MDLGTIAAIAVATNKNKIKKSSLGKNFVLRFFALLVMIIAVGVSALLLVIL